MKSKIKVCHFTTKHKADDNRILELQALNLLKIGYDVYIVGKSNNEIIIDGVKIIPIKSGLFAILKQLRDLDCSIYQFHDPQLLLTGVVLKVFGKKVIFDSHENYEEKIKSRVESKLLIMKPFKLVIAKVWWLYEKVCISMLDGKVVADSTVLNKYGKNTVLVPNVPGEAFYKNMPPRKRTDDSFRLIYVGTITRDRGIVETIAAIQKTRNKNVEFHIIGETNDKLLIEHIKNSPKTIWHGRVQWRDLKYQLVEADAGVVLLQPIDAYLYYPGENIVKLWEYMSMRLPVLISDFPKLEELNQKLRFGINVRPDDTDKIAQAIDWMIENPEECAIYGQNGRKAVEEEYNAEKQIRKLLWLYEEILSNK